MSLTRAGLLTLGLIGLLAAVLLWVDSVASDVAWRSLLVAAAAVIGWDAFCASRQRLRLVAPDVYLLPLGRAVPVAFRLDAVRVAGRALQLRPDLPPGLVTDESVLSLPMPGRNGLQLGMSVRATVLGEHTWAVLRTRISGPLGLAWWRHDLPAGRTFRVVPDPSVRPPATPASSNVGPRHRAIAGWGHEILQLRRYRPGDSRRSIDWKATARTSELITREFSVEQHQEVIIAIDVGRSSALEFAGLQRLGRYVNLASRLAQLASRDDDRVGLVAFADRPVITCPPVRAAIAQARLQQVLAGLEVRPVESNPLLAVLSLRSMVRHRALVVLMTELDDPSLSSQLVDAIRMLLPKHLPLVVDLHSPEVDALARHTPTNWTDPYVAVAAREYMAGIQANRARLTRLGAQVVMARPASAERELTMAVMDLKARRRL